MRFLKNLAFVVCLLVGGHAYADNDARLSPLKIPAIPVHDPSRSLLISVANAGDRLVAVGGHGVIVYSDDNGQTWRQASVPTTETIACVAFADAKNGWAGGAQGVVLHTVDGGADWQLQLTGPQVISLMNSAAAQLMAAKPDDEAAQRAVHRASIFTNDGPDKPFLTILPLSPQSAIIFGAYRMTVRTDDGGKTWVDWSLHLADPVSHSIYDMTQMDNSVYLVGEAGTVQRSDDQGQSFSLLGVPDPSTMFGILGTPKNTLLTFGVAGEVFRSTDQGKTWAQSQIKATSDLNDGIILPSGNVVLISEDGSVYESKDDGLTFTNLELNLGMAAYGLGRAANGDIIIVGSGGVRVEPQAVFN